MNYILRFLKKKIQKISIKGAKNGRDGKRVILFAWVILFSQLDSMGQNLLSFSPPNKKNFPRTPPEIIQVVRSIKGLSETVFGFALSQLAAARDAF